MAMVKAYGDAVLSLARRSASQLPQGRSEYCTLRCTIRVDASSAPRNRVTGIHVLNSCFVFCHPTFEDGRNLRATCITPCRIVAPTFRPNPSLHHRLTLPCCVVCCVQDEREQLAMCVFPPGAQPPVYVSVWLALDDCDAVNGCLEVQ